MKMAGGEASDSDKGSVSKIGVGRAKLKRKKNADSDSDTLSLNSVDSVVNQMALNRKKKGDKRNTECLDSEFEMNYDDDDEENKEDAITKMQRTTAELTKHLVMNCKIGGEELLEALSIAAKYEETLVRVITHKGGVMSSKKQRKRNRNRSRSKSAAAVKNAITPKVTPAVQKVKAKPVKNTYAVIVKDDTGATAAQIQEKIAACPNKVDVRVKSIQPTANGAIRIQTCSQSEMLSLKQCPAIKNAGLVVEDSKPIVPKIMVMDVSSILETGPLMQELWAKNLRDHMTFEEYEKQVHVVKRTKDTELVGNLILEVSERVRALLSSQRRVYLGWLTHQVRVLESSPGCHNCYAFGHIMSQCKLRMVCRKCGQEGHSAANCTGTESCRNCRLAGKDDAHLVTSVSRCPLLKNSRRGAGPHNG